MAAPAKAYKGIAMEGLVARWYARNTAPDVRRFERLATAVAAVAPEGARVLEVAPGPGYLAIELARRGYRVTAVDISASFVRIARENAARAQVPLDIRHGDAAHLPVPDAAVDAVVCSAAFKNFTDPLGALDEMHRVLVPGGVATIFDLRREASLAAIDDEVRGMGLSAVNRAITRWTFRHLLLRTAYARDELERLAERSRFGRGDIREQGVGFALSLVKRS